MTTTAIKSMLQAAIFTGAVGLIPTVALADGGTTASGAEATERAPDHAAAEARTKGGATGAEVPRGVPDHAAAEARSQGGAASTTGAEVPRGVPDHAAAEARSTSHAD